MLPSSWKAEIEETIDRSVESEGQRQQALNHKNATDIAAAIKSFGESYTARHNKPEKVDKVKRAIDLATLFLLFVTALFTALAWWTFGGQLDEMRKAYGPLKDTADATKAALVAGQRAWIRIDSMAVGGAGLLAKRESVDAPIAFVITNVGNTPALRVWPYVKLLTARDSLLDEQAKLCDEPTRQPGQTLGHTLFPNEQFPKNIGIGEYSVGTHLSKEEVARGLGVDNKTIPLFVVGCIDYTFPTDPTAHHQTPFIREIDQNPVPIPISIDDGLIPPGKLVLREHIVGIGRASN
ncbi:hypothetical protein [Bradyrhizobium sp. B120]|uniref:hypothetical protein n=1 Tax=Bradyrhizobium sp. B120 TaxID=3410088 RepID=UPI003B984B87